MAYENGYNYYGYCYEVVERYMKDQLIFIKALQVLQYMQTRPDYPFCIDEINDVSEKILGQSLYGLSRVFGGWMSPPMYWKLSEAVTYKDGEVFESYPKSFTQEMAENFEREMDAFCIAMRPLMSDMFNQNFLVDTSIKQISYLKNYNDNYSIRFIKNDNSVFDIQCNKEQLSEFTTSLQGVLNDDK